MTSVTARSRLAIGSACLALTGGALLYLTRQTDPAAVVWLDRAGLGAVAVLVRGARHVVHTNVHLPAWLRGSASDATFGFALGALLADAPRAIIALGLLVVLGHELAQGLGLAAGTFDVLDLVVLFASFVIASMTFRPRNALAHPTRTPT
jgi:hypothetical protein